MGKTLQTIACIVSNTPSEEDIEEYSRVTLIVVPAGAIEQWEKEIGKHAEHNVIGDVLCYKKSHKVPKGIVEKSGIL